jgi:glycosyltransferase involved in cell wall biosynthesis
MKMPGKLTLLEVTSTWRASERDAQPGFVRELCERLGANFNVVAVVPRRFGVDIRSLDAVAVRAFHYAPERMQLLGCDGGLMQSLKKHPWQWLLVPLYVIALCVAIYRALKSTAVDVLHAHWWFPCGFAALVARTLARSDVPVLVTCHGADVYALKGWGIDGLKRQVLSRADGVIAVSEKMRADLLRLLPVPRSIGYAPMGVDLVQTFTPADPQQPRDIDLLFVGRLVEKKGLDTLVRALMLLGEGTPPIRVVVVGDGPLAGVMRSAATALPARIVIEFDGARGKQELPGYYRRARFTVFPSRVASNGDQEGLGLVPIESMGCGSVVLASDLQVVRETVDDGVTGFLFSPDDPAALAGLIQRVLALDAENISAMGARARATVLEKYDWRVAEARYTDYICKAVADGTRAR